MTKLFNESEIDQQNKILYWLRKVESEIGCHMEEKYSVSLTKAQYNALADIRGLDADAHSLVMCASLAPDGWTLKGTQRDFEKLATNLNEEVGEQLCPQKNIRKLIQIINIIEEQFPYEDEF